MYGYYDISDFSIAFEEITARIEKDEDVYYYIREIRKGESNVRNGRDNGDDRNREIKEKIILGKGGRVIVNPIEPVNLPKEITNFLQIKFKKPVFSEPKSSVDVYITFPIEVGVFLAAKKNIDILDIFSLNRPKFSLYGNPRNGIICRHWQSDVFSKMPEVNPSREGVMLLRVTNTSSEWIEISNVVFDVYAMKIYFDENTVSSKASVNISSQRVAETMFIAKPLKPGMTKALELYTARKMPVVGKKFVMEWGL